MPQTQNVHDRPKLLILYASYGEGHLQAARAIRDAMEQYGQTNVKMFDLMAESHPWINGMTRRLYMKSYTHIPQLYGWMYDITKPMKHNSLFGSWLHSFGRQKITRLVKEERPDAIVYTFPLFALIGRRQSLAAGRIPSYTVITDFDLHRRWVHPGIDRYYVATEDLRKELAALGIPRRNVSVSGIPLKPGFQSAGPLPELQSRYRLDPRRRTVLIMAGAQGVLAHVSSICKSLLQDPEIQILLVCGRNSLLKASIERRFAGLRERERLHTLGYVDRIHELMALADCIVTKPGGITLAEAIASGLPIFLFRPCPGQEKQNALYLASKGAAVIADDAESLAARICGLLHDPVRLAAACSRVKGLHAPPASLSAAQYIALDILSSLPQGRHATLL